MATFLYPTWDYENTGQAGDDKEIWQKLMTYVENKAALTSTAPNKTIAGPLLLNFLEHEMLKDNFISIKQYTTKSSTNKRLAEMKISVISRGQIIDATAVAPFIVPEEPNDDYAIKKDAYYNFRIRGRTFNGKTKEGVNGKTGIFDKSSITMLVGTGNYQRIIDGCPVLKLKDNNGISPFDMVKPVTVTVNVTDTADSAQIQVDSTAGLLVGMIGTIDGGGNIGKIKSVDSGTQITMQSSNRRITGDKIVFDDGGGVEVPRGDIDIVQNDILRPYFKFLRFVNEAFNLQPTDCHSDDRMILLLENLGRLFVDSKLDITGHPWRRVQLKGNDADKVPVPPVLKKKKPPTPEQPYDLKDIDRERIALDALLWTKREYGNQFKRTDPSVYDLFEALQIPKNLTLEGALTELIGRLTARKLQTANAWEPSIYTFYGNKRGRGRTAIWESALVHCLQGTTAQAYTRAIVDHIFLNPSVQNGQQRYSNADLFASGGRDFKSNAFESFDQELAQNYATHMRANQDSNKYLMILNLPWPETKRHLRKQPERNRYYPEAFVEARYPEVFYVKLKHEHEACHRLRKVGYALSLSREKGYPVISRRQVVAPDAFHTDYNTLPLPRIATDAVGAEYWSGHNPSLIKEYGREAHRSQATPELFVKPISEHPLYPSRMKANF